MGEMLHFLNGAPMKEFDYHTLIKTCFSFYNLKRETVDLLRQKCTTIVEEEIRELERRREAAKQRLEAMRKQQAETAVVEDTSNSS
jgi:predicted phosphoribosyltransferase